MWYQRKNVTHEEAEKENQRMIALEDRADDEFDEARIEDMTSGEELDVLKNIPVAKEKIGEK